MRNESEQSTRVRVENPQSRGKTHAMVTGCEMQAHLHGVLVREYGFRRHAAKLLATITGASPRTAEKWLAGTHMPQGAALLRLMANCEAVDTEMSRMKALARGERR